MLTDGRGRLRRLRGLRAARTCWRPTPPARGLVVVTRASPLRGRRAEGAREACPRHGVGMGSGEMQDDPADRAHDLYAKRDERLPEARHLRPAKRGPVGAELQFLAEDEGRGGQRDAQVIGPEARATGAAEGEG